MPFSGTRLTDVVHRLAFGSLLAAVALTRLSGRTIRQAARLRPRLEQA